MTLCYYCSGTARCHICSGTGVPGDGRVCAICGGNGKCTHSTFGVMGRVTADLEARRSIELNVSKVPRLTITECRFLVAQDLVA